MDTEDDLRESSGTGLCAENKHRGSKKVLEKKLIKPWQKKQWRPPLRVIGEIDAAYLHSMEAVLDTYHREAEVGEVRLCLDERPCQLLEEVRQPLPIKEGKPFRQDSEYKRKGTCNIFLAYDIYKGIRYCKVTKRRTKVDYALFVDELLSKHYSQAEKITLVQDNLNTHGYGSFFAALDEQRAWHLREKNSFCFTPIHGSCRSGTGSTSQR